MSDAVERHLEVARTARYWVIGEDVSNPAEVWFVLHGYKQLACRFLRRFEPLADGTRLLVAAEGLSRFYAEESPGRHGPGAVVGATWGDFLPADLDLAAARNAWRTTEVVFARGRADRVFADPHATEEELRIRRAGLVARRVAYDAGHDIHQPTLRALAAEV